MRLFKTHEKPSRFSVFENHIYYLLKKISLRQPFWLLFRKQIFREWMSVPYKKLAHQYHKLRQKNPAQKTCENQQNAQNFLVGPIYPVWHFDHWWKPEVQKFSWLATCPMSPDTCPLFTLIKPPTQISDQSILKLFLIWGKPRFSHQFLLSAWKHTCLHAAREHACAHKKSKKRTILSHKMKKIDYYPPSWFLRSKAQNFSVFSTYQEPNSHTKNEEHYSTATT